MCTLNLTVDRARRLRRSLTLPEVLLWTDLRDHRCVGLRFRRQNPMGPFILDFFCAEARLAVEIDGEGHGDKTQMEHDLRRDAWLMQRGVRVLRVLARDVLASEWRAAVMEMIARLSRTVAPSTPHGAVPLPRSAGEDKGSL